MWTAPVYALVFILVSLASGQTSIPGTATRFDFEGISLNGKSYFGGGYNGGEYAVARVDVYDNAIPGLATPISLSVGRYRIGVVASDNAVFFAGGALRLGNQECDYPSNVVDVIFNNGTQSVIYLSVPRCDVGAVRAGKSIFRSWLRCS